MAFFGNFDETNSTPTTNYELVPAGWYHAKIEKAEVKQTKAGDGNYLNVQYKIIGPSLAGRVVFGMINVKNKNPEAERIGTDQIGQLRVALGFKKISDTDQLLGQEVEIKVGISPAKDGFDESNTVKGWKGVVSAEGIGVKASPLGSTFGGFGR